MSLHELILGQTPISNSLDMFVKARNPKSKFHRYRDAFLIERGTVLQIYTRLGNEEYWKKEIKKIRSREGYLDRDMIDYFDNTYRIFHFKLSGRSLSNGRKIWEVYRGINALDKITLDGMYKRRSEILGLYYYAG